MTNLQRDFRKEEFGLLRVQVWNPDCQNCALNSGGGAIPSSPAPAGLSCASSHPLSPVHLLAPIPCNNQILRSSKSPHRLFLLFWWGCKLRKAKQVVPRAWAEPQECIPEGTRSPFPSRLDVNLGNSAGDPGAKACPRALIVGVEQQKCEFKVCQQAQTRKQTLQLQAGLFWLGRDL